MPFDDTLFLKSNVDVLTILSTEELRRLTSDIERRLFFKGQIVIRQGEIPRDLHVIRRGSVAVLAREGTEHAVLAELSRGDFFGEMTLLDARAAGATIKAMEDDTEILLIPTPVLKQLVNEKPSLKKCLEDRIADHARHRREVFKPAGEGAPRSLLDQPS